MLHIELKPSGLCDPRAYDMLGRQNIVQMLLKAQNELTPDWRQL